MLLLKMLLWLMPPLGGGSQWQEDVLFTDNLPSPKLSKNFMCNSHNDTAMHSTQQCQFINHTLLQSALIHFKISLKKIPDQKVEGAEVMKKAKYQKKPLVNCSKNTFLPINRINSCLASLGPKFHSNSIQKLELY